MLFRSRHDAWKLGRDLFFYLEFSLLITKYIGPTCFFYLEVIVKMTEILVSGTEIFSDAKLTETPYEWRRVDMYEWLIMKPCMYVGYHNANNVSNFGSDPIKLKKRFIVLFTLFYGHGAP